MKQRIDHSNYEAWLLDRLEGRLTPEEERELTAFLLANPDLDTGLDELPTVSVEAAELDEQTKDRLKRALPPVGRVDEHTVMDFIIARYEGDLTSQQEAELADFMQAHPEHGRAEKLYRASRLEKEPLSHPEKSALHRTLPPAGLPVAGDLDDFLVALMEGDLNAEQERAVAAIIESDAGTRGSWTLMQSTRTPREKIAYPDKGSLKRSARVIPIAWGAWVARMAAAAAVVLLFGLGWWWLHAPAVNEARYADHEPLPAVKREATTVPQGHGLALQDSAMEERAAAPRRAQDHRNHGTRTAPVADTAAHHAPAVPLNNQPEPAPPLVAHEPIQQQDTARDDQQILPDAEEMGPVASVESPGESVTAAARTVPTLRQALTGALRERVLDRPADFPRSLDDTDAEVAADRAVRAVAGQHAGFVMRRDAQGRNRGFQLKLGRHLAVSARR